MDELDQVRAAIRTFRDERDWKQFHNPKDMAAAISIEAAELQEIFLWKSSSESVQVAEVEKERVYEEVADIAIYLFELADNLQIDLASAIEAKLIKNAKRYPAEQARGSSKKYTEYLRKPDSHK
jgi:NTP pyrophosphatase (non-canonical NTP hydrolase)